MGLVEIASSNSAWRGMDYYDVQKVVTWEFSGVGIYDGVVSDSEDNAYTVHIDTEHPRKSFYNCPFADGKRIVFKRMIALYFTVEPVAAVKAIHYFSLHFLGLYCFPCSKSWTMTRFNLSATLWVLVSEKCTSTK